MKIVVFAPYAAIWAHSYPEALIVEALKQSGHDIVYVTCGTALKSYCHSMSAYAYKFDTLNELKAEVCKVCIKTKNLIKKEFHFAGYDFDSKLSSADYALANKLAQEMTRENFSDFTFEGLDLGKYALYEFILGHKKIALTFDDLQWQEYSAALYHCILCCIAAKKIFEQEKPDRLLLHNSLYSTNRTLSELAKKFGIQDYDSYPGGNLSRQNSALMLGWGGRININRYSLDHWEQYKKIPINNEMMNIVSSHYMELFSGKSVFAYSPGKELNTRNSSIRDAFSIPRDSKILLAVMSSYDEIYAARAIGMEPEQFAPTFKSQVEWVKALLDYTRAHPEVFLIIRVHPREFTNKRDDTKSEHASLLEKEFETMPVNARVNWPKENISLYSLLDEIDVGLCAWSSVAKDMTLLGIPTVTYALDFLCYPADLTFIAKSKQDLFEKIDLATSTGWSAEFSRMTYRWVALEYFHSIVDIQESAAKSESTNYSLLNRILRKALRTLDPMYKQKIDVRSRQSELQAKPLINEVVSQNVRSVIDYVSKKEVAKPATLAEETKFLKIQLKSIYERLYGEHRLNTQRTTLQTRLYNFINN